MASSRVRATNASPLLHLDAQCLAGLRPCRNSPRCLQSVSRSQIHMQGRSSADLLSRQERLSQGLRVPQSALHDPSFHGVDLTLHEVLEASTREEIRTASDWLWLRQDRHKDHDKITNRVMDLKALTNTSTLRFLLFWSITIVTILCSSITYYYRTYTRPSPVVEPGAIALMASTSPLDSKKRLALAIIDFLSNSLNGRSHPLHTQTAPYRES